MSKQIKERWGETELKNYDPFHNMRTFRSWLSLGFRVRKGEKALKSVSFSEEKDANGNVIKRILRCGFSFLLSTSRENQRQMKRKMTVSYKANRCDLVPNIRIQNRYLKDAGFSIGDEIIIKYSKGEIIIKKLIKLNL